MSSLGAPPRSGKEAAADAIVTAELRRAVQCIGSEMGQPPRELLLLKGKLATISRLGLAEPDENLGGEEAVGIGLDALAQVAAPAAQAKIIAAPLEHGGSELDR